MKTFIFTILFFAASQAVALQKCIIDGKTLYTQGLCTQGTAEGTPGLERQARQSIKIEKEQKAQAELDRQAQQNIAIQEQSEGQAAFDHQAKQHIATQEQQNAQAAFDRQAAVDEQLRVRAELEQQLREVPNQYNSFDEAIAAKNRIKDEQRALGFRTPADDLSDKVDKLGRQMQMNKVFRENGQAEPY